MGGRLLDWLGQGTAASRPAAAGMAALIVPNSIAFYYANDTQILSVYDDNVVGWFDIDVAAISALSFQTLPDVDWSTPPTDGQIFEWDTTSSKLIPVDKPLPGLTTEQFQDAVGAMGVNGTGTTFTYDDTAGTIKFDSTITQYTDEMAQDAIAAAFAAGTHVGITVTYDDVGNFFDLDLIPSYIQGLADGQIAAASVDDLADVDTTTTPPADGDVLTWVAAGSKWEPAAPASGSGTPSGTAFPGSPATNDRFIRTDRNIEYFYDGTRWLSTQLLSISYQILNTGVTADSTYYLAVPYQGTYSIWLERIDIAYHRTAAGEWDLLLGRMDNANVTTNIVTLDGAGDPTSSWRHKSATINALLNSSAEALTITADEISGTAAYYGGGVILYRLVG